MNTTLLCMLSRLTSILLVVSALATSAAQAASSFTTNAYMQTEVGGFQSDPQGPAPPPGVLVSTVSDSTASNTGISGPATATATATTGSIAAGVDALYSSGSFFLNSATAMATITDSLTNTTGADLPWTYNYTLFGPDLLLADYYGLGNGSSLLAGFDFGLQAISGGSQIDIGSSARLNGGILGHTLFTDGTDPLGSTFFSVSANEFGYSFDNLTDSIGGILTPGDTVTVNATFSLFVDGPSFDTGGSALAADLNIVAAATGFSTGGIALAGDPDNLAGSPGFSGAFAVVPVPPAIWLLLSGLLTFGARLRKTGGSQDCCSE